MSERRELAADQLAVLKLLLVRGRSYEQIGEALKTDAPGVRRRATDALSALAGERATAGLAASDRELLSDAIVLGAPDPAATALLDSSPEARAFTRQAREALVAEGLLPAEETGASRSERVHREAEEPRTEDASASPAPSVSRTGGAILLGVLAAAAVLLVLWQTGVLGGEDDKGSSASTTTATATSGLRVLKQVNLLPPGGGSAKGIAQIAEQDGQRGISVIGQGLPASSFYALWISKGGRWSRLGFFPVVRASGSAAGRLSGFVAGIPAGILGYDRIVVSREKQSDPRSPAQIVLAGRISG